MNNYPCCRILTKIPNPQFSGDKLIPNEMINSFTEVKLQKSYQKLTLQLSRHDDGLLKYSFSLEDNFKHKIKIANEMVNTYLNNQGKDLNLEHKKNYFDLGDIKINFGDNKGTWASNSSGSNFIIDHNIDYFKSFLHPPESYKNELLAEWPKTESSPESYKNELLAEWPKTGSYVKDMKYDSTRERIEVGIETAHFNYSSDYYFRPSPANLETNRIKNNLIINIKSRANPIRNISENEQIAIDTLREMITEAEFRKYMTHGFILVKGSSGRIYQIFRTCDHTKVWEKGKLIEEVCVRIKRDMKVPPTDNVIAFRTMILCSENEFKKLGNVYKMVA